MPLEDVPTHWSAWRAVQHQPGRDWDWLLLQCGFLGEWIKAEGVLLNVQRFGRLQSIPHVHLRLTQYLYCCGFGVAVFSPCSGAYEECDTTLVCLIGQMISA